MNKPLRLSPGGIVSRFMLPVSAMPAPNREPFAVPCRPGLFPAPATFPQAYCNVLHLYCNRLLFFTPGHNKAPGGQAAGGIYTRVRRKHRMGRRPKNSKPERHLSTADQSDPGILFCSSRIKSCGHDNTISPGCQSIRPILSAGDALFWSAGGCGGQVRPVLLPLM